MSTVSIPTEILLKRFFRRKRRFIKFTSLKAADIILQNEQKLIAEALTELATRGVDGESYFESAQGQVEYTIFCVNEDQKEAIFSRCERCSHHIHVPAGTCEVHREIPFACKEFDDTGYSEEERLTLFKYGRCSKCVYNKNNGCIVGRNQLNPECSEFTI